MKDELNFLILTDFESSFLAKRAAPFGISARQVHAFPNLEIQEIAKAPPKGTVLFFSPQSLASSENFDFFVDQVKEFSKLTSLLLVALPQRSSFDYKEKLVCELSLVNKLSSEPVFFFDAQNFLPLIQGNIFDSRLEYMAKCPYSLPALEVFAGFALHYKNCLLGNAAKLIILDLDNTLWSGILSEDGPQGIVLGEPEPVGRVYREIQALLAEVKNAGMLLAICSKNNSTEVTNFLNTSNDMILKIEDFIEVSVDWTTKPQRIFKICQNLNILPSHVIFVDDDRHERESVKQLIPEINVLDMPDEPMSWPNFLRRNIGYPRFNGTWEDKNRTSLMKTQTQRLALRHLAKSEEAWLKSLAAGLSIVKLNQDNLMRATQLLNKTNQFNLFEDRKSERELWLWHSFSNREVLLVEYSDALSNDGLISLIAYEISNESLFIYDFVLSCRAFGRSIEFKILEYLFDLKVRLNLKSVYFRFQKNERNLKAQEFIDQIQVLSKVDPPFILAQLLLGRAEHLSLKIGSR